MELLVSKSYQIITIRTNTAKLRPFTKLTSLLLFSFFIFKCLPSDIEKSFIDISFPKYFSCYLDRESSIMAFRVILSIVYSVIRTKRPFLFCHDIFFRIFIYLLVFVKPSNPKNAQRIKPLRKFKQKPTKTRNLQMLS